MATLNISVILFYCTWNHTINAKPHINRPRSFVASGPSVWNDLVFIQHIATIPKWTEDNKTIPLTGAFVTDSALKIAPYEFSNLLTHSERKA